MRNAFKYKKNEMIGDKMESGMKFELLNLLGMLAIFGIFACLLSVPILANGVNESDEEDVNEEDVNVSINASENVTEEERNVTEEKAVKAAVDVRYDIITYGYNKTIAGMDEVRAYLEENEIDASIFIELKENFSNIYKTLITYVETNDPSGFGKAVAEMHKIAAKYKAKTAQTVAPGEMGQLRSKVYEKVNQTEGNMTAIKARIEEKKKAVYEKLAEVNAKKVDIFIGKISKKLNISTINVTRIKGELLDKVGDLKNATTKEEVKERIDEIKDLMKEAKKEVASVAKKVNEKAMENALSVVSALENKGMNVSGVNEKLETIKAVKDEIKESCIDIKSNECIEKIKELKSEINDIIKDVKIITKAGKEKVEIENGGNKEIEEDEEEIKEEEEETDENDEEE